MKTTAGKYILVTVALVLGVLRIPLVSAIIIWVVTAGTVVAIERLGKR